jgi:hypothetical protein
VHFALCRTRVNPCLRCGLAKPAGRPESRRIPVVAGFLPIEAGISLGRLAVFFRIDSCVGQLDLGSLTTLATLGIL